MSKSKLSLLWEMKTTLPASSDFHWDFMHKDNSAALLLYTMTETAISLTARKPFLPPEFGRTDFSSVLMPSAASQVEKYWHLQSGRDFNGSKHSS